MASCHRTARKWMLRTTSLMAQFAILSAGCAPIVTAKFPEVYPPPSVKSDATKVGFAPVADSRRDEGAGWNGAGIPVVAGAGLTNYIDHKFRSQMVEEGFAPIDAPDPESGSNSAPFRTVLITLQSTNLGNSGTAFVHQIASADIAVQVFAAGSHTIVFAQSYKGTHHENGDPGPQLAAAADWAIDETFADKAFLKALR
jgi:hypothetical protein